MTDIHLQPDGFKEPKFSLWRWLGFGPTHVPRPDDEEGFAPGYMVTNVFLFLDWKDRLRIAFSGKVHVQTVSQTDVFVRRVCSRSHVRALPPTWKEADGD
jgi:hypothetical protein